MLSTHQGLEARVHLHQEWRLTGHGEHPLLNHGALNVIVLDNDVLLQDLDRIQLVRALALGQHDLKRIVKTYCKLPTNV